MVVISLCSCEKLDFDTATIEIGETHTDLDGLSFKIQDVVWDEENLKLETLWTNETAYRIMYGESYFIEYFKKDKWVSCAKKDLYFTSVGYILEPGESEDKTYNIAKSFDVSKEGKYRLITDCFEDGNSSVKYNLCAEFYVIPNDNIKKTSVDFNAQYIRTGSKSKINPYPLISVIQSQNELNAYYNSNKEYFDLERRTDVASDNTRGFLDVCDKYDTEFFKNNSLVFVVLEEGSGSIRHNVDKSLVDEKGKLYIEISTKVPEIGTTDMAQWHIIIETKKDNIPKSPDDIEVYLDDESITHMLYHNQPLEENETSDIFVPKYAFSLTWDVYGISSYDSQTGKLVKTTDATNPEDYITTLKLTEKQYTKIWKLINNLDIEDYPDEYNPHGNAVSTPYMTLKLSVKTDKFHKTVTAEETVLLYHTDNEKGNKFLATCKGIIDILTSTKEWKALPEYEKIYD